MPGAATGHKGFFIEKALFQLLERFAEVQFSYNFAGCKGSTGLRSIRPTTGTWHKSIEVEIRP
jgi:hypothetical protein